MRPYILRALLRKEVHRHLLNRGGLTLSGLLVVASLMLSVFDPKTAGGIGGVGGGEGAAETGGLVGGVHHCYLFYFQETPLIKYLRTHVPPHLKDAVVVRKVRPEDIKEKSTAVPGVGTILVESEEGKDGREILRFTVWHPKDNPAAMAGYEQWFWKEARRGLQLEAAEKLRAAGGDPSRLPEPKFSDDDLWAVLESYRSLNAQVELIRPGAGSGTVGNRPPLLPDVEIRRDGLMVSTLRLRDAIATAMVVFALYFTCVYLLPTLNCEERERGVLLAQALSPASPAEILTAKFLFYPALGVGLSTLLTGIYKVKVLTFLFYWLAVFTVACGFLGIGMTVAALSRTQRAAFLGSMCYLLSVTLLLMIVQQNSIPFVQNLALEYHGPRILHAAICEDVGHYWPNLLAAAALSAGWVWMAGFLFRRRGWQ